jgi:hypothetical protein
MTAYSLNNNRVAKTADAPIASRNLSQTAQPCSKKTPGRPDDRHAEQRGRYAEQAKARRLLLGRLRHPVAHGLGESCQKQALDRKHETDGGSEVTQFTLPFAFQAWNRPMSAQPASAS